MQEVIKDYPLEPSQRLKRAVLTASRVTLEIGPGVHPLFYEQGDSDVFDNNDVYVGWNIDPQQHKVLAEYFMGIFDDEPQDTTGVYALHIPHTPDLRQDLLDYIPASSVDLIIAGNVVGEPDSTDIYRGFDEVRHSVAGYVGSTSWAQTNETLDVAWELLKPDGLFVCYETLTPECAFQFIDYGYLPTVEAHYRSKGQRFKLIDHTFLKKSEASFADLMAKYAPRRLGLGDISPNSFIYVFQKLADWP